jgi:hypothetical protein
LRWCSPRRGPQLPKEIAGRLYRVLKFGLVLEVLSLRPHCRDWLENKKCPPDGSAPLATKGGAALHKRRRAGSSIHPNFLLLFSIRPDLTALSNADEKIFLLNYVYSMMNPLGPAATAIDKIGSQYLSFRKFLRRGLIDRIIAA